MDKNTRDMWVAIVVLYFMIFAVCVGEIPSMRKKYYDDTEKTRLSNFNHTKRLSESLSKHIDKEIGYILKCYEY